MSGRLGHPVDGGNVNREWWPKQINLKLRQKNSAEIGPFGPDYDYAA